MGPTCFRKIHLLRHRCSTGCSGYLLHHGASSAPPDLGLTSVVFSAVSQSLFPPPLFIQHLLPFKCFHRGATMLTGQLCPVADSLEPAMSGMGNPRLLLREATTAAPLQPKSYHLHSVRLSSSSGLKTFFQYEGIY